MREYILEMRSERRALVVCYRLFDRLKSLCCFNVSHVIPKERAEALSFIVVAKGVYQLMRVAVLAASMAVLQPVPNVARRAELVQLLAPVAVVLAAEVLVPMQADPVELPELVELVEQAVLAKVVQRPEVAIVAVVLAVALAAGFAPQVRHIVQVPGVVLHPTVQLKRGP